MSFFGLSLKSRRGKSAQTAKDRLQLLLAHERSGGAGAPDYLPALQREIVEVVRKYVKVEDESVDIRMDRSDDVSSLEINVELPAGRAASSAARS